MLPFLSPVGRAFQSASVADAEEKQDASRQKIEKMPYPNDFNGPYPRVVLAILNILCGYEEKVFNITSGPELVDEPSLEAVVRLATRDPGWAYAARELPDPICGLGAASVCQFGHQMAAPRAERRGCAQRVAGGLQAR